MLSLQLLDTVAQLGGMFKFQQPCRVLHFLGQFLNQLEPFGLGQLLDRLIQLLIVGRDFNHIPHFLDDGLRDDAMLFVVFHLDRAAAES